MKKRLTLAAAAVIISCRALAQEPVSLYGYYEFQATGARIGGRFVQLSSNKLRLDLKADPARNVTVGANVNLITWHGKTTWNILDFLPPSLTETIPETVRPWYTLPFRDRIYLDNAWVRIALRYADITLGRQQLSFGSGYVWNPLDLFNTRDVLDPAYEQPGHNALRADLPLAARVTLTAVYGPADSWEHSTKQALLKIGVARMDITLSAAETRWNRHDYETVSEDPLQPGFAPAPAQRTLIGGALAGEMAGLGVHAEYARNCMNPGRDFTEFSGGIDYTFKSGVYLLTEYYRNSLGRTGSGDYTLNDWMRFLAAEQKTAARDQVYGLLQIPLTDLASLGLSTIYVVGDGSAALVPTLSWSLLQNVELTAYLNLYTGRSGSFYAPGMGSGGMVRFRIYF
ncbi:hypothetical protein JXO52_09025 [bacterium]|nr:hypothetical protein [bacterium]